MKRVQVGIAESARETFVQAAAAAGALLIVISLFLPWYTVGLSDSAKGLAEIGAQSELGGDSAEAEAASDLIDESVKYTGWSSLELADALLLFVAIGAGLFALRRRSGESDRPREGDDRLMMLGLLAVVVVMVLLLTKNSFLGMIGSTIDFAQDQASSFDTGGAELDVLAISAGIGLWLGLLGSLLTLAAGFFHSLVDATGVAQPAAAREPVTAQTEVAPAPPAAPGAGPVPPAPPPAPTQPGHEPGQPPASQ